MLSEISRINEKISDNEINERKCEKLKIQEEEKLRRNQSKISTAEASQEKELDEIMESMLVGLISKEILYDPLKEMLQKVKNCFNNYSILIGCQRIKVL